MSEPDEAKELTRAEHIARHKELHEALDRLLADFICHTNGAVLNRPIGELMEWSYRQTQSPDHKP